MDSPSRASSKRVVPIVAAAAANDDGAGQSVSLYEKQKKIYPRSVQGWFAKWRWVLVWATQLLFYGLPWLPWNGRQSVLFDLGARRFYIFDLVLYPQDFIYLTGLLVISAFSLFFFTAVAGRLWCGYACPQTVYTEIFLWIEHRIEGERGARMKLDAGLWNLNKVVRKGGKHAVWLTLSLWTGFTFVGYFTPIATLVDEARRHAFERDAVRLVGARADCGGREAVEQAAGRVLLVVEEAAVEERGLEDRHLQPPEDAA